MPESLSSPQMLGNAPAQITLSTNATELIRQIIQHQQALQIHQQQQQQQQQNQNQQNQKSKTKHSITEAAAIRSSSSSPDGGHERSDPAASRISLDGDEEDTRPESVGSSSPPPASTSRSSSRGNNTNGSNNPNSIRPQRKLKIYGVEEKLDIIDYAKIIGNRAAGREYNVAESSIREWRKNEAKLRTQAENARSTQNPNPEKEAFYEKLYGALVTYINSEGEGITWKMVRDKCKELWDKWGNGFPEGQVSMHLQGWVARFIQKARQAKDIQEVPPPIPTTNSSTSSSSSLINGITMVPTSSAVDLSTPLPSSAIVASSSSSASSSNAPASTVSQPPPAKRSRISNSCSNNNNESSNISSSKDSPSTSKSIKSSSLNFVEPSTPKSRRKNIAPKRVNDATLKTSTTMPLDLSTRKSLDAKESSSSNTASSSKKLSSDVENDEDNAIEVC